MCYRSSLLTSLGATDSTPFLCMGEYHSTIICAQFSLSIHLLSPYLGYYKHCCKNMHVKMTLQCTEFISFGYMPSNDFLDKMEFCSLFCKGLLHSFPYWPHLFIVCQQCMDSLFPHILLIFTSFYLFDTNPHSNWGEIYLTVVSVMFSWGLVILNIFLKNA